jgi:hypothetical protein
MPTNTTVRPKPNTFVVARSDIIFASQFRVLNDSVLDHFMEKDTSQSENNPIAH